MRVKYGAYILVVALMLSFASLLYSSLTTSSLIVNFLLAAILFLFYKRNDIDFVFLLCLTVLSLSLIITNVNHSALGSTFIVLNVFMYCYLFNNLKVQDVYCVNIRMLFSLLLMVYCATCDNSLLFYYQTTKDALGNTVNGNHLGCLALINFFNLTILLNEKIKSKKKNVLVVFLAVFTAVYINITGCRTALFSMLAYLMLMVFKQRPFEEDSFKIIIRTELIACLAFPLFYIFLSNRVADFEFIGKTLFSGREILWKSGFDLIALYPIFGSGNDFMYSLGNDTIASSHNFILGIVKMFGIIPTLVLIYIFPLTTDSCKNKIRQFVIISSLLFGFTEASFIGSHSSLFFMMLFLQSHPEYKLKAIGL